MQHIRILTTSLLVLAGLATGCVSTTAANPKHVLVVTTTTGFRHSSIPIAEKTIEQLGKESGAFTVEFARVEPKDPQFRGADGKPDKEKVDAAIKSVLAEKMSPAALKRYDAIIFANTTGDLPMPDRDALIKFVESGKGFVGMHSATDTFPGFPEYNKMTGAHFKQHGAQVEADCINQDQTCPACRHLPASWKVFDEIYQFKDFDRARVHGLLTLDKHPNNKTPGDYPVAWVRKVGKGRLFYTSLGHREDMWDPEYSDAKEGRKNSPEIARAYQQHILGGIKWALGLENFDVKHAD